MRIINPNPGECTDRQTILHIKCRVGLEKNAEKDKAGVGRTVNIQPFIDELNQINSYMEKNWFLITPKTIQKAYDEGYKALVEVNQKLWDLEDKIRALKLEYGQTEAPEPFSLLKTIADTAFSIAEVNDERAALVHKINGLFGIEAREKMY